MLNRIRSFLLLKLFLLGMASLLIACGDGGGGGTSSSGSVTAGSLVYLPGTAVSVADGASYDLTLDLINSSGVSGQVINLTVADTSIATVSPSTCTLSSGSIASSECNLKIRGISSGKTTRLIASSSAYTNLSIAITTTAANTVNFGALAVQNGTTDGAQYVTTTPITLNYANGGSQISVNAKLSGSSNVTGDTTITFTPSTGTATPASCSVTSTSPFCQTVVTGLPTSGTTPITVSALSTLSPGNTYTPITVNATAPSTPTPSGPTNGAINIGTQNIHSGNQVPQGMKAPIFVNLQSNGKADTATVTLTLKNADGSPWTSASAFSLYSYNATNNTQQYQWGGTGTTISSSPAGGTALPTCALTLTATGCGYGIVANASSGSVIVSGTVSSSSGYTYSLEPLQLTAIPVNLSDVARAVTFTNNSLTQNIWVAITGGAAASYINPTTTAGSVSTNNKSVTAVGANLCGPSAPQNACPMGSSCIQGGATPGPLTGIGATPYYCYWDQGTPDSGYLIASNGGQTTLNISKYSLAPGPSPIIWSGNFSPRQGCNSTTGVCSNAGCASSIAKGLACGPGTGPNPGINTLAELTFQESPSVTDYYDVSIIGGANFATSFGPTSAGLTAGTSAYTCGTPGSSTNQPTAGGSGYVANSVATLPSAPWTMGATSTSFLAGSGISNALAPGYFRVVNGGSGAACPAGTCSAAGEVCGYGGFSALLNATPPNYTPVCGQQLTWVSANQVWSQNQNATGTGSNTAPFSFAANTGTNTVGNYQLCSGTTFSAYNGAGSTPTSAACGGVMWGTSQTGQVANGFTWSPPTNDGTIPTGLGITQPSQPVNYASTNWLTYVLPTIQWLKTACPTCYTFPFDDMSSTFQCSNKTNAISYGVNFSDLR